MVILHNNDLETVCKVRKEERIRGRKFAFKMNHKATININYVRRPPEIRGKCNSSIRERINSMNNKEKTKTRI